VSTGEKSEQPTPKRLRDARNKGQVAQSKDVGSTVLLVAMFAFLFIGGGWIFEQLQDLVVYPAQFVGQQFHESMRSVASYTFYKIMLISFPVAVLVIVVGSFTNFLIVGPLFVVQPLKPELKKLDPVAKAKQIFSMKNLMEFLKSTIKVVFLGILLYLVIRGSLRGLVEIPYAGIGGVVQLLGEVMWQMAKYTVFAYVVIAFADFMFQRKQHIKQLMMTKDEVKREYKEMEGDPTIKSKRRQLQQELVMSNTTEKVRKSSVLVTNPTHRAVGIYYREGETKLPTITAKGEGFVAKRMIEIAQEEGIPIMQNIPLAHNLFDNAEIDQYIPSELIEPIAEVLRWVRQLQQEQGDA
jgi:type III secretion protein U